LLCRFSHSFSDDVNGWLAGEIAALDIGKAIESVPEGGEPEFMEELSMPYA
jgi:hypothetical protein